MRTIPTLETPFCCFVMPIYVVKDIIDCLFTENNSVVTVLVNLGCQKPILTHCTVLHRIYD